MGLEPMIPSSTQEKKAPVWVRENWCPLWNNICASIHTHINNLKTTQKHARSKHISTSRPHKHTQGVNILVIQACLFEN